MRHVLHVLGTLALCLVGIGASAAEFSPVLSVARNTWPEGRHIAVVCSYRESVDQVQTLAKAAGEGYHITVVDALSPNHIASVRQILQQRKPNYLLLLPEGRVFREGSFESTRLISNLAFHGIPAVGTTPMAIKQGAVFAVGEATGNEVLVTDRLRGSISVVLPSRGQFLGTMAAKGSATVSVESLP